MRFLAGSPKLAPPIDPIMSEGSTSRGSGVKAIIADLQQKIAESDGECARVDRGWSGRVPGGRLPPRFPRGLAQRELLRMPVFSRFLSPAHRRGPRPVPAALVCGRSLSSLSHATTFRVLISPLLYRFPLLYPHISIPLSDMSLPLSGFRRSLVFGGWSGWSGWGDYFFLLVR